jgi:histidinol phosphatase-like enzyme (inositol monophosphatase family)
MASDDLATLRDFAIELGYIAARAILPHFRTDLGVVNKASAGFDPVTIADRNAEVAIRREIARAYPDHGILGEELGEYQGGGRYRWIIDPIDGTRSFMLGQLHWGTLIALTDGGRPVIGVMHQPFTEETFIGSPLGAELRHQGTIRKLRTRPAKPLAETVICATHPAMFDDARSQAAFARVSAQARSVRYGGDCYTPCMVAAGYADLVIEAAMKAWDIQPLIPIVEAAGGVITDWSGGDPCNADRVIVAGDRKLHGQVVEALGWSRN